LPLPQDDPKQRRPDITLAKECLKWQPTVTLRDGLHHTIAYFDRLLSGADAAANAIRSSAKARRVSLANGLPVPRGQD